MQKSDKFEMIQSSLDTKLNVISIEHNRMCRLHMIAQLVVIDRVGDLKEALGFH